MFCEMLTSLEYKCVNKQTCWVRVRSVFKVRNFRTRTRTRTSEKLCFSVLFLKFSVKFFPATFWIPPLIGRSNCKLRHTRPPERFEGRLGCVAARAARLRSGADFGRRFKTRLHTTQIPIPVFILFPFALRCLKNKYVNALTQKRTLLFCSSSLLI
jgi:hypothetical protein